MQYFFFLFKVSVSTDQSAVSVQATARNTSQNATISMAPSLVIGVSNRNKGNVRATPSGMSACPMEGNREVLWREIAEPVKKVKEKEVEVEVVNMIHQDRIKDGEYAAAVLINHIKEENFDRLQGQKQRPRAGTLIYETRENKEVIDLIPRPGTSKLKV